MATRQLKDYPYRHEFPFYCNPSIKDFQRLDAYRVERLGLEQRFARTYDVTRNDPRPPITYEGLKNCRGRQMLPGIWDNHYEMRNRFSNVNVLAPFTSLQKRVNGIFFEFDTDHRRKKFKLPPAGHRMPRWRVLADYNLYN